MSKTKNNSELLFWMLVEKPYATMGSLNSKFCTVHFSFGDVQCEIKLCGDCDKIKRAKILN